MTQRIAPGDCSEREIVFSGIGGQGIQLTAKVLAEAATNEGKHVMLFGVYICSYRTGRNGGK